MLTKRTALLTVALFAGACGDDPPDPSDPSEPAGMVGVYRLTTVNGNALPWAPPPSQGLQPVIETGDLHLYDDGTFGVGAGGRNAGWYMSGTYRVDNNAVRLIPTDGFAMDTTTAIVAGDSAVIQMGFRYAFRRAATPQNPTAGIFVLNAINGRAGSPLIQYDSTLNGQRYVVRVHFDTLRFIDGTFYRRHRYESNVQYLPGGDSIVNEWEFTKFGAHERFSVAFVLRSYTREVYEPMRDTLWVAGDDLVRRTRLAVGTQEDLYVRR